MTTMYVTYDGNADTPFDRGHWIDVHLPLVRECRGPYGLVGVSGFFPSGDGAGRIAVAVCDFDFLGASMGSVFRDEASMVAALASAGTERVMADVKKVTAVEPRRSRDLPL